MSCALRIAGIVLCTTLLCGPPAAATTMVGLSTDELAHLASVIAVATVQSLTTVRADGLLTTNATLEVESPIKGGRAGDLVTVRVPGGSEGHLVQRVEGAPTLVEGEHAIVFLEPAGTDFYRFVGLEQGHLLLQPDLAHPGEWLIHRSSATRLVRRGPDGELHEVEALPETEALGPYLEHLYGVVEQGP